MGQAAGGVADAVVVGRTFAALGVGGGAISRYISGGSDADLKEEDKK